MGFFDFLKPKEKQEESTEIVEADKLEKFINFLVREKFGDINKIVTEFSEEINNNIIGVKESVRKLETASLMNENIPLRHRQIMEGNKDNFIKKIIAFVNELEIPKGYLEINRFCEDFTKSLEKLAIETQKNQYILKEFHEHEAAEVNKKIKELEKTVFKLKSLFERENIKELMELDNKIKSISNGKIKEKETEEKIKAEEKEINELKEKIKKLDERKQSTLQSTDYRTLQNFKKEKEDIELKIKKEKEIVNELFSDIGNALKKYHHRAFDVVLAKKYIEDWHSALIGDSELKIAEIFNDLQKNIDDGKIILKDRKRDKTEESLKKLSKQFLEHERNIFLKLEEQKDEVITKINKNSASMNIGEQEYWIRNLTERIDEHERRIDDYEKEIEKINIDNIMKSIERIVLETTGRKILIKNR